MKQIHPRYWVVSKAENELSEFWLSLLERHELTDGEAVKLLSSLLAQLAKYVIQYERHPNDPDKKGDEE